MVESTGNDNLNLNRNCKPYCHGQKLCCALIIIGLQRLFLDYRKTIDTMAYYDNDTVYQTQTQALNDCYTVNSLKTLAKLICDDIPTRKADLIAAITGAMAGEKIKGVFDRLDRIGQHIVAEAVFAPDGKVDYRKIEAKYQSSSGAGHHSEYLSESDLLSLFIINRQVPADMRGRLKTFVPIPKSDHVKYVNKLPQSIKSDIEGEPGLPLAIRRTARAALHNLEVVLRLIDGGKLKVSPTTGRPTCHPGLCLAADCPGRRVGPSRRQQPQANQKRLQGAGWKPAAGD